MVSAIGCHDQSVLRGLDWRLLLDRLLMRHRLWLRKRLYLHNRRLRLHGDNFLSWLIDTDNLRMIDLLYWLLLYWL